jgi:hypothetical protein
LPDFKRKPEEHYTPQEWRVGLHNRGVHHWIRRSENKLSCSMQPEIRSKG